MKFIEKVLRISSQFQSACTIEKYASIFFFYYSIACGRFAHMFVGNMSERKQKKVAKVSGSCFFFSAHKNCIQFTFECCSNFTVNLTTVDGLKMPSGERMCICYTFNSLLWRTCLAIFVRRDLARRLRRRSFIQRFFFRFIDECPPTMMLKFWWISLEKTASQWLHEDEYWWAYSHSRLNMCNLTIKEMSSSMRIPEFPLCCRWNFLQKAHGNAHNSFSQWHTIWKIR